MATDPGAGAEDPATFDAGGVRIAYDDLGEGDPIVLVHGFASSRRGNWKDPGWYDALFEAGRRVVALDCRGHGESGKPHDPGSYGHETMAADVVRLMDHLSIETADLMGYSMGGAITTQLLSEHADRFDTAVVAGVGSGVVEGLDGRDHIADALQADSVDDVETAVGRRFRLFAEESGNDLLALAAVMRARSAPADTDRLAEVSLPVLVVAGTEDDLVDDPATVADLFGNAEAVAVEGTDHITTVGDPRYREAVLAFLEREGL